MLRDPAQQWSVLFIDNVQADSLAAELAAFKDVRARVLVCVLHMRAQDLQATAVGDLRLLMPADVDAWLAMMAAVLALAPGVQ